MKPGDIVKLKITGEEVMVLEIGPKSKNVVMQTQHGPMTSRQEYLAEGTVQIRTKSLQIANVWEFEIEGVEYQEDEKSVIEALRSVGRG